MQKEASWCKVCLNVLTIKYWEMLPPAPPPNILQAEIKGLLPI